MERPKTTREYAQFMRSHPTNMEKALAYLLREQPYRFSRQVVIGSYIVDFCCRSLKLIVECDGVAHEGREAEDAERQACLEAKGYQVLRFKNDDVRLRADEVLKQIVVACERPRFRY